MTPNFVDLIVERITRTASHGAGADIQGRLFEIEHAKHLGGKQVTHYRSSAGQHPHDVVSHARLALGSVHSMNVSAAAKKAAQHTLSYLNQHHGITPAHIGHVAWTSQPKDIERHTGVQGIRASADNVASLRTPTAAGHKHVGLSLKIGNAPSLRSPGIKDLTSSLPHAAPHVNRLIEGGERKKNAFARKHLKGSLTDKARHKAFSELGNSEHGDALKSHFKQIHAGMAKHFSRGFNQLPHEYQHAFLRKMTDSEHSGHGMLNLRVHYNPSKGSVHISNPAAEADQFHQNVRKYSAKSNGSMMHVFAHKGRNKHKVISINFKNKESSPYTGHAAIVKAGADNPRKS